VSSAAGYSSESNDVSTEAEESLLLESVAGERLLKTQQAANCLAVAMVICKVWRLAVAL
jgi:hypothetical protein